MDISLSPFAPENLVSRDGFGSSAVPSRVSLLIPVLTLNLMLTYNGEFLPDMILLTHQFNVTTIVEPD